MTLVGSRCDALTVVACNAASFFKSSDPRFAISRVDSVRSCLWKSCKAWATQLIQPTQHSQTLPNMSCIPIRSQLIHQLEYALYVRVDLENLHRQRRLQVCERSFLLGSRGRTDGRVRRLRQPSLDILEAHGGRRGWTLYRLNCRSRRDRILSHKGNCSLINDCEQEGIWRTSLGR